MKPGQIIADRYEIRGVIGRGGMGEVYLAHDHRLDTDVAMKRVPLELALESQIRDALVREGRILAKLSDSHIVRLFDLADTVEGMFLVLEFVCGPSLDKVLAERKTLSVEELQHVLKHVALGLTRAHSMGVVHRDLKPSNLLVSLIGQEQEAYLQNGAAPPTLLNAEIKVTDFGLAKMIVANAEASRYISGTPSYMAPEQIRGELPSPETDIYALGLVAYVCLAGRSPIGDMEPIYFHLHVTPPPIEGIPLHINAAIAKAIHKQREKRFSSVAEFVSALRTPAQAVHREPKRATTVDPPPIEELPRAQPVPPQPVRNVSAGLWISIAAVVGLAVLAVTVVAFFIRKPVRASEHAVVESETAVNLVESEPAVNEALTPLPPLNPAPRIDEPPPVIESARRPASTAPLPVGIDAPVVSARLRVTGNRVFDVGYDGTVYLTSDRSNIGAVRDGRLLWQYKLGGDDGQMFIASDGLIWIRSMHGVQRLFCFNAAGQGGEFVDPAAVQKYLRFASDEQTSAGAPQCVDPNASHRDPGVEVRRAGGWRTALDHRCQKDPVIGPDGSILVQTQSRTMYLLSADGRPMWTYPAPCVFDATTLLASAVAVGLCSDRRSIVGVRDGRQAFLIESKDSLSAPVAQDRTGHFYRLTETNVYDQKLLTRTDSAGNDLWTLPLRLPLSPEAVMASDGTMYLLNASPDGSYALVVESESH